MATGDLVGNIALIDTANGDTVRNFSLSNSNMIVAEIDFNPTGDRIAVVGGDFVSTSRERIVKVFEIETGELVWSSDDFEYGGRSVTFSNDGSKLAVGTIQFGPGWEDQEDGELLLFDANTGEILYRYDVNQMVYDILFTPDDSELVVGTVHDGLLVFDIESGELLMNPAPAVIFSLDWIDDHQLIAGNGGGFALRIDMQTGEVVQTYPGFENVAIVAVRPGQPHFLGVDGEGGIQLVNYETGERLFELKRPAHRSWNARFSPDGKRAYTGHWSNLVSEWSFDPLPLDELIEWIHENRYILELPCDERERYQIEPLCETEAE